MIWEFSVGLIGLAFVLGAAVVQLCLEHFWPERPARLRRWWAYILCLFVIAGAIVNELDTRQRQAEEREEQERIELAATAREQQARLERQEISANIWGLVTLARERDPGLSETEALRTILTELRTLRKRTAQYERDLQGVRQYSEMAKLNVLGLTGKAGVGLKEDSQLARTLEGAYIKIEGANGPEYHPRCDAEGLARLENAARGFPDFPFSYWALAKCLKKAENPQWRIFAERAKSIFEHTTRFGGHSPNHDQALKQMKQLLTEQ